MLSIVLFDWTTYSYNVQLSTSDANPSTHQDTVRTSAPEFSKICPSLLWRHYFSVSSRPIR